MKNLKMFLDNFVYLHRTSVKWKLTSPIPLLWRPQLRPSILNMRRVEKPFPHKRGVSLEVDPWLLPEPRIRLEPLSDLDIVGLVRPTILICWVVGTESGRPCLRSISCWSGRRLASSCSALSISHDILGRSTWAFPHHPSWFEGRFVYLIPLLCLESRSGYFLNSNTCCSSLLSRISN